MPVSGLREMPVQPNSEVVVLPSRMAPACLSRAAAGLAAGV